MSGPYQAPAQTGAGIPDGPAIYVGIFFFVAVLVVGGLSFAFKGSVQF